MVDSYRPFMNNIVTAGCELRKEIGGWGEKGPGVQRFPLPRPQFPRVRQFRSGILKALNRMAFVLWLQGQHGTSRSLLEQGLQLPDRDPASQAWALARLARFDLQEGDLQEARLRSEQALSEMPGYVPALLVKAQVLLARREFESALPMPTRGGGCRKINGWP